MKNPLLIIHRRKWFVRWPAKVLAGVTAVTAVLFPYPDRLATHVERWQQPNILIEPDHPKITELVAEIEPALEADLQPPQILRKVERFVYKKVPYAWDWDTWGTVDYIPTVSEVFEQAREDCDGRAVIAASMLRKLGYEAELVTNFTHVWVKTNKGETMSPGKTKVIVATDQGLKVDANNLFANISKAAGYGVAVFPLGRELILALVLWWLSLRPGGGMFASFVALVLLINALLFIRIGSADHKAPDQLIQLAGLANFVLAMLLLWVVARFGRKSPERSMLNDAESH